MSYIGVDTGSNSFTPVLKFGGGSTGIVYLTQVGSWRQIGRLVSVYIFVSISNAGSSTGVATIENLPVQPSNNGNLSFDSFYVGSMTSSTLSLTAGYWPQIIANSGLTKACQLYQCNGLLQPQITNTSFAVGSSIVATINYFA